MDVRCVVTGRNESGKSVIVRNTPVKPVSVALFPGYEFHRLWGSDSVPELPSDGTRHRSLAICHERMVFASVSLLCLRIQARASIRSEKRLLSKRFSRSCRV